MYWTLGGAGFPFGANDPQAELSVLSGLQREIGAPVIAALGFVGAVAAITMARVRRRGLLRTALLGFAWIVAAVLTLVVPDYRVRVTIAFFPVFLLGAPFGWPPGVDLGEFFPWTVLNQFVCVIGGIAFAGTALRAQRRLAGACAACGRQRPSAC